MKTLRLSTLVLLLASVFYSCTKDDASLSTSAKQVKPEKEEVTTGNDKADVFLTINFSPEIGIKDGEVTVTGTFTEESPKPDCGHLQLEMLVDGEWEEFGEKADVSASNHEVSHTFTPTVAGEDAYKFRLHYVASGGQCDFNQEQSDEFTLDVTDACEFEEFKVTGDAEVVLYDAEKGLYDITVTFTLSTPKAMENIYFQGGATAGGQKEHILVTKGDMEIRHENNQNTVLYWKGSLTDCGEEKLSFTYRRRFNCSEDAGKAVTGEWTVSGGGLEEPYTVSPVVGYCSQD